MMSGFFAPSAASLLYVYVLLLLISSASALVLLPLNLNLNVRPTLTTTSAQNTSSLTPNTTLTSPPSEYTVPGTRPLIRILSFPPDQRQARIPRSEWTAAIIEASEEISATIHEEGPNAQLPPQGRTFGTRPVALHAQPFFGVYGRFYYMTLSTAISAIWQIVLEHECRTWSFEVMMGNGQGVKQGAHVGSVAIEYFGHLRVPGEGGGGVGGGGVQQS